MPPSPANIATGNPRHRVFECLSRQDRSASADRDGELPSARALSTRAARIAPDIFASSHAWELTFAKAVSTSPPRGMQSSRIRIRGARGHRVHLSSCAARCRQQSPNRAKPTGPHMRPHGANTTFRRTWDCRNRPFGFRLSGPPPPHEPASDFVPSRPSARSSDPRLRRVAHQFHTSPRREVGRFRSMSQRVLQRCGFPSIVRDQGSARAKNGDTCRREWRRRRGSPHRVSESGRTTVRFASLQPTVLQRPVVSPLSSRLDLCAVRSTWYLSNPVLGCAAH